MTVRSALLGADCGGCELDHIERAADGFNRRMLYKPFEDAYDAFLRRSPPGATPAVIELGQSALRAFRRYSPDATYDLCGHTCRIELLAGAEPWACRLR